MRLSLIADLQMAATTVHDNRGFEWSQRIDDESIGVKANSHPRFCGILYGNLLVFFML